MCLRVCEDILGTGLGIDRDGVRSRVMPYVCESPHRDSKRMCVCVCMCVVKGFVRPECIPASFPVTVGIFTSAPREPDQGKASHESQWKMTV